jgi:hypothetical protein
MLEITAPVSSRMLTHHHGAGKYPDVKVQFHAMLKCVLVVITDIVSVFLILFVVHFITCLICGLCSYQLLVSLSFVVTLCTLSIGWELFSFYLWVEQNTQPSRHNIWTQ